MGQNEQVVELQGLKENCLSLPEKKTKANTKGIRERKKKKERREKREGCGEKAKGQSRVYSWFPF
jgi:hypothetical protein